MEKLLTIKSHRGEYKVFFKDDLSFLEELKKRGGVWVIDQNIFRLYRDRFSDIPRDSIILLNTCEEQKTAESALALCRQLVMASCRRNTSFISVGGGITQDVTGFVASTLYRGLNWTFIPTTLLAQADSCIGSKTSLNLDSYKNLLGTFYPPNEIFISGEFLKTLPEKEIFSGSGEIVKLHLINAKSRGDIIELAHKIEVNQIPNLLYDSQLIKKTYVEEDEFDHGKRKILNYGHCFGHPFESVSDFRIPHGLAVVAGMIFANIIARRRNRIDAEIFEIVIPRVLLPIFHREMVELSEKFFGPEKLWEAMTKDKKRTGDGLAIILPRGFGLELAQDLIREEFDRALDELKSILKPSV